MQASKTRKRPSLRAWMHGSRLRYAMVNTGLGMLIVIGLTSLDGVPSARYFLWAIPAAALAFLVHGWFWYPRAKRKADA